MINLSINCPPPDSGACCSGFKNYKETTDAQGRSVLVECSDPYEGMSADSFGLAAQLEAGVPMQHISPISSGSLSQIDANNREAELFVENLSKPQVPQVNE